MEEFFRDFHFLRPWYLLLWFLPLLFYWKFFRGVRNKSSWEAVCDKRLLDFLLVRGSSAQRRAVSYLGFCRFCRCGAGTERPGLAEKGSSRFGAGESGHAALEHVDRHGGQRPYAQPPDPRQVRDFRFAETSAKRSGRSDCLYPRTFFDYADNRRPGAD